MTWQARAFLLIMAARHIGVAAVIWFSSLEFPEGSYQVIRELQPLDTWAWLFAGVGAAALVALAVDRIRWARRVIFLSVALTSCWALGFIAAAIEGTLVAPTAPLVWSALAGKDIILALSDLSPRLGPPSLSR